MYIVFEERPSAANGSLQCHLKLFPLSVMLQSRLRFWPARKRLRCARSKASHKAASVCLPKGSRFQRRVPANTTGSCVLDKSHNELLHLRRLRRRKRYWREVVLAHYFSVPDGCVSSLLALERGNKLHSAALLHCFESPIKLTPMSRIAFCKNLGQMPLLVFV